MIVLLSVLAYRTCVLNEQVRPWLNLRSRATENHGKGIPVGGEVIAVAGNNHGNANILLGIRSGRQDLMVTFRCRSSRMWTGVFPTLSRVDGLVGVADGTEGQVQCWV